MIEEAIKKFPFSMAQAAECLNVPFGTFKYRAIKFGLYLPNNAHIKNNPKRVGKKCELDHFLEFLDGQVEYKGSGQAVKARLIRFGFKQDICEECGQVPIHMNRPLVLQLDHIDGDHFNWKLENLRILCPNCHTQTSTHSGRSGKIGKSRTITDISMDEIVNTVNENNITSVAELARTLGVNYRSSSVIRILSPFMKKV